MAIDLPTIAKTYLGGLVEGIPSFIGPDIKGFYTPLDQWPADVKEGYNYNPEGAKKLLAEAGYPKGFQTHCETASNFDLDLLQVVKSYFAQIGVDMEIRVRDFASHRAFIRAFSHDALAYDDRISAVIYDPLTTIGKFSTVNYTNYSCVNDPVYDDLYNRATVSLDQAEFKRLIIEANDRAMAQHWAVSLPPNISVTAYQPWLKGYSGELVASVGRGPLFAGFWVDQELKKAMGR